MCYQQISACPSLQKIHLHLPLAELEGVLEHWARQKPDFLPHLEELRIGMTKRTPCSRPRAWRMSILIQTFLSPRVPTLLNKHLPFRELLIPRLINQAWFEQHVPCVTLLSD